MYKDFKYPQNTERFARGQHLLSPLIELESSFSLPAQVADSWRRMVNRHGFRPAVNRANSVYLDEPDLGFFLHAHHTLRTRGAGNAVRVGTGSREHWETTQKFPQQLAIKHRLSGWEQAAFDIVHPKCPEWPRESGVFPRIRIENEGMFDWSPTATSFGCVDLSKEKWRGSRHSAREVMGQLIREGKIPYLQKLRDAKFSPIGTTAVQRELREFCFDYDCAFDFGRHFILNPAPTPDMTKRGKYLRIEAVIDDCVLRLSPPGWTINAIVTANKNMLRDFTFVGERSLFE